MDLLPIYQSFRSKTYWPFRRTPRENLPEKPWVIFLSDQPPPAEGMFQTWRKAGHQVGYLLWERQPCLKAGQVALMQDQVDDLLILPYRPTGLAQKNVFADLIRKSTPARFSGFLHAVGRFLARLRIQIQPRPACPEMVHTALQAMMYPRPVKAVITLQPYLLPCLSTARARQIQTIVDTRSVFADWKRWGPILRAGARMVKRADLVLAPRHPNAGFLAKLVARDRLMWMKEEEHADSQTTAALLERLKAKVPMAG